MKGVFFCFFFAKNDDIWGNKIQQSPQTPDKKRPPYIWHFHMNKLHRGDLHYTKATVALLLHSISNHAVMVFFFFFSTFDASAGSLVLSYQQAWRRELISVPVGVEDFSRFPFFFFLYWPDCFGLNEIFWGGVQMFPYFCPLIFVLPPFFHCPL